MVEALVGIVICLLVVAIVLLVIQLRRASRDPAAPLAPKIDALSSAQERTERLVQEELKRNREENTGSARHLREEVGASIKGMSDSVEKRVAEMRNAARLVERLDAEFERVELFIDTGVRTELYNASAALASVTLTRRAADAARNNLELVVDLYRRGKVDIITLVDAQTQSLVADLAAADAAYDYVLALLFVNREISHFRNLDTEEEKREFARRLEEFVLAADAASARSAPAAPAP